MSRSVERTITGLSPGATNPQFFTSDALPAIDNVFDLGALSQRWQSVFAMDATYTFDVNVGGTVNASDIAVQNNLNVGGALEADSLRVGDIDDTVIPEWNETYIETNRTIVAPRIQSTSWLTSPWISTMGFTQVDKLYVSRDTDTTSSTDINAALKIDGSIACAKRVWAQAILSNTSITASTINATTSITTPTIDTTTVNANLLEVDQINANDIFSATTINGNGLILSGDASLAAVECTTVNSSTSVTTPIVNASTSINAPVANTPVVNATSSITTPLLTASSSVTTNNLITANVNASAFINGFGVTASSEVSSPLGTFSTVDAVEIDASTSVSSPLGTFSTVDAVNIFSGNIQSDTYRTLTTLNTASPPTVPDVFAAELGIKRSDNPSQVGLRISYSTDMPSGAFPGAFINSANRPLVIGTRALRSDPSFVGIGFENGNSLQFHTSTGSASGEPMRLTGTGRLGVNTTTPQGRFHANVSTTVPNPASWSANYVLIGPAAAASGATSSALGFSYDNTNNFGILTCIAPSSVWRRMQHHALDHSFYAATTGNNLDLKFAVESGRILSNVPAQINGNATITGNTRVSGSVGSLYNQSYMMFPFFPNNEEVTVITTSPVTMSTDDLLQNGLHVQTSAARTILPPSRTNVMAAVPSFVNISRWPIQSATVPFLLRNASTSLGNLTFSSPDGGSFVKGPNVLTPGQRALFHVSYDTTGQIWVHNFGNVV